MDPSNEKQMATTNHTKVPDIKSPEARVLLTKPDDGVSPNPKGRDTPEKDASGRKLFACTRTTKISTMNVRTLRNDRLREEITVSMDEQNIEVLGIQEHRIVHDDGELIRYENISGKTLITSSAWRNQTTSAAEGGVGVLLGRLAVDALTEAKVYSERVIKIELTGNPKVTCVVTYCPTSAAKEKEIENHYTILREATESTPKHNILIVLGDFNARLGPTDALYSYPDPYSHTTNNNGEYLMDLLAETGLEASNTRFRKKPGKMWTYVDPNGKKRQLDFILFLKKWANSMKNCQAYNSFGNVGSDHRIVTAEIKLSFRKIKFPAIKANFDWKSFREDPILQDRYEVEVKNRFEILAKETTDSTAKYACFVTANEEARKSLIPIKRGAKLIGLRMNRRCEEHPMKSSKNTRHT